ncbi:hypothetical protein DERF_004271 [Dermatophagoides farinae]|uniref:BLOC-2 complex member HPS3 N-terminal domain-containing protein n=2 Tax=Dermatophagoides farinae TaxID=6954 RepID=A0A922L9V6_DERFA|nr:hypothetical protein DERF_004271 [Dermatophagoides farinae]
MDALQYQQVMKIMADNRHDRFVDHSRTDDLLYWFQKQQTFLTECGATHVGVTGDDDIFVIRDLYSCIDIYGRQQIDEWSTTNLTNSNNNNDYDHRLPIQSIPIVRQIKVITYRYVGPKSIRHSSLSYLALLIEKKQIIRRRQILIYPNFPAKNVSIMANYEHFRPAGISRDIEMDIDSIEANIIIEDKEYSDLRTIACCPNDGHIAIGLANEPMILIYELIIVDQCRSIIDFIRIKRIRISFIADIIRFNSGYCAYMSNDHVQIIRITEFNKQSKHENSIVDKKIVYNNLMVKPGQHEIYGPMTPKACPFKIYNDNDLNDESIDAGNGHVFCRTLNPAISFDSIPLNRPIHHSSTLIDVKNYSNHNKNSQYLSYQIEMENIDNDIIIVYILWNDHLWAYAIYLKRDPMRLIPISSRSLNGRFVNCFAVNIRHDVIYVLGNDGLSIYASHVHNFLTKFRSDTVPSIKRMFLIGKNQFFGAQSIIQGMAFVLLACMPSTGVSTIYLLDKPNIRSLHDYCRHSIRQINSDHDQSEDVIIPLKILAEICWNPITTKTRPYDRNLLDRLIGQTIRRIISTIKSDDIVILRRKVLARLFNLLADSAYNALISLYVDEYFDSFITYDDDQIVIEKTGNKLPILDPKIVIIDDQCFRYFPAISTTMLIDIENDTLPMQTNELNPNDRIYQFYYYLFGLLRFSLQFSSSSSSSSSSGNDLNYCKQLFAELRYEIEQQFL